MLFFNRYESNGIIINHDEENNTTNKRLSWTILSRQVNILTSIYTLTYP